MDLNETTELRLGETRTYPVPAEFAAQANVDASIYRTANADPIAFWESAARRLEWAEPWHTAHTWVPPIAGGSKESGQLRVPKATWFEGGKLNVAYNCVDRHVIAGRGDKVALYSTLR